jgi:uncharacterized protein (DUF2267 family)
MRRIADLSGLDTTEEAAAVLQATLVAMGQRLAPDVRDTIAAALPDEIGAVLRRSESELESESESESEFFDRVRRREGVSLGFAREHAQGVCRALGEILPGEALRALEEALPASFAELFHPPPPPAPPPGYRVAKSERHHTLATGRPGSRHPLSESRPPTAQSHSVVREANPHADTKLSSASGLTQERLEESLATAHPSKGRRISNASD